MAQNRLTVVAASLAAVIAVGYPATAWYLGKQIETAHGDARAMIATQPYLKVASHSYERGLFSASETTTIEIPAALFRMPQAKADDSADPADSGTEGAEASKQEKPAAPPFRFTVKTTIQHGPLPGFAKLAAGSETSTIEFDEPLRTKLQEAFGTAQPFDIRTTYDFQGGGRSTFASQPFKFLLPGNTSESKAMLTGERVEMVMEFSKGLAEYSLRGTAPRFAISEPGGTNLVMSGAAIDSQLKRVFPEDPLLYAGSQKITVAELSITPADGASDTKGPAQKLALKEIAYDVQMPVSGAFIDMIAKMGASTVQVGEQNYGPAHYDFSLKHLHARKLATLSHGLMALYAKPEIFADQGKLLQALATLKAPFFDLLADGPVFSIDRIAFHTADGDANLSASVKLADAKPEDFSNPLMLLAKLEAAVEVTLPASLIQNLAAGDSESDEEKQQTTATAGQTIENLVQQGFATREGNAIKSRLSFKTGQLLVNDKPLNPLTLMQKPNL